MFSQLLASMRDWRSVDLSSPGNFPAWLTSLTLHIFLLVVISLLTYTVPGRFDLTLTIPDEAELELVPEEFHFDDSASEVIGALSNDGMSTAMASAPTIADLAEVETEPDVDIYETGDIELVEEWETVTTPLDTTTRLVKGVAGVGVTGANGAIDRITHEILLSLEDRDTLVVWLFDQSGSLNRQREEINERLKRIYGELGLIRDDISDPHSNREPLLTAALGFGKSTNWVLRKPTADMNEIRTAVGSLKTDDSGVENVFTAIYDAATEFEKWRRNRNVMLIAVTDEVGDDHRAMLEKCVLTCRKNAMPVYVIGVPAAFGQSETLLKWVDPDSRYDQTPKWGRVSQGPETLRSQRLHLPFSNGPSETIDSGFGPFALTRLCYQTGGIYFAIHPNRDVGRRVGRRETEEFSSHFAHFFDSQRMRAYQPEYVSIEEHDRTARANPMRKALIRGAEIDFAKAGRLETRFVKRDEADFSNRLTESQKVAAKLEPRLNSLFATLKQGEAGRPGEESLRWQAAYDLAYGQTLAVLVRIRGYNEMLAKAKRGLKPTEERNNTWTLQPDKELSTSSRLERYAETAKEHLERVVEDHDGTPWALIAKRELGQPMGWKWQESFTRAQPANRVAAGNGNQRTPRDDQRRMLPKGPAKRPIPKL